MHKKAARYGRLSFLRDDTRSPWKQTFGNQPKPGEQLPNFCEQCFDTPGFVNVASTGNSC